VKGLGRMAARHTFHFDNVFGSFATQEEIFEQTLEPIVHDVLAGFQSTVFAYGQTGESIAATWRFVIVVLVPNQLAEPHKHLPCH
jgi:hypothetical protein